MSVPASEGVPPWAATDPIRVFEVAATRGGGDLERTKLWQAVAALAVNLDAAATAAERGESLVDQAMVSPARDLLQRLPTAVPEVAGLPPHLNPATLAALAKTTARTLFAALSSRTTLDDVPDEIAKAVADAVELLTALADVALRQRCRGGEVAEDTSLRATATERSRQ